ICVVCRYRLIHILCRREALKVNQLRNPEGANQIFGFSAACYGLMRRRLELNLPAPCSLKDCRPVKDIVDHSPKSWLKKVVATLNEEDKVCQIHYDEIFTNRQAAYIRLKDCPIGCG
uniref:Uncharacterized protein n=1 Tax=Glossina morsitans morsitans TaxID=37546 RepID=A0A1B0GC93_GLOMM